MSNTVLLPMWVIYDHPTDFPEHFVARKWKVDAGGSHPSNAVVVGKTLDEVREYLRNLGLVVIKRDAQDDPKIVETWL